MAVVVFGFLGGYVAAAVLVATWVAAFGDDGVGPALVSSVGLWVGFLGAAAYESRRRRQSIAGMVGLDVRPSDGPVGTVVGVGLQLVAVPGLYWMISLIVGPLDIDGAAKDLTRGAQGASWIAVVLVVGVGAPIVEEIFFRGLLMRLITERTGVTVGVIGSSVIFASTHFQVVQFPGLLLAGLGFAAVAARWQRLGPAIVCHIAFNLTTITQLMLARR